MVEQERLDDGPIRKAVYLPKREWEREDEDDDGTDVTIRQELIEDFEDVGNTTPLSENRDGDSPLSNLFNEVTEEEVIEEPSRVEAPTVPFETNLRGWTLIRGQAGDEAPGRAADGPVQAALGHRERIQKLKTFLVET